MPAPRSRSIRAHILLIVVFGAIVPLALIGAWLTASAVRSGKELLRAQLDVLGQGIDASVQQQWALRQGDLLLLADNLAARHVVSASRAIAPTNEDSAYLADLHRRLSPTISWFAYFDATGHERWNSQQLPSDEPAIGSLQRQVRPSATLPVTFPTHDADRRVIGRLDARVALDALIAADSKRLDVPGAQLSIRDGSSGAPLSGSALVTPHGGGGEMRWRDSVWMVVTRRVIAPPLELTLAAPTAPYVEPFQRAARSGFAAVLLVALFALAISAYLTTRLTRSLDRLVEATSAVSHGDLDRRVDLAGPRELETLATSFNAMTESLRRTMAELSRRSALAAVGEFAASLAHEVRNALTSIKLDLQRAEERLPVDSTSRELVTRSLSAVTYLDSTVTGALRIGRSGAVTAQPLDLTPVLIAAAGRAAPMFTASQSTLDVGHVDGLSLRVSGDPSALEELFVNLLLNSAQALPAGGRAQLVAHADNDTIVVSLWDNGRGIARAELEHVLEPFYTTRSGGTGLGLPIARQLAVAHGGELRVESEIGVGTTVTVVLPRAESAGSSNPCP